MMSETDMTNPVSSAFAPVMTLMWSPSLEHLRTLLTGIQTSCSWKSMSTGMIVRILVSPLKRFIASGWMITKWLGEWKWSSDRTTVHKGTST